MVNNKWNNIISKIDFDIQPIVNIKSGKTYAIEVFLRNFDKSCSFYSINNFFNEAFNDGVLYQVDLLLRMKAVKKYKKVNVENLRLFYNVDPRIVTMPDFTTGNTEAISKTLNIDKNIIFFEISEKSTLIDVSYVKTLSSRYKQEGYSVVIDNFATGLTGIQLLNYPTCDFIKLDRLFIQNIHKDTKKRLFFKSIVDMAHINNIKVIASCVETIEEYYVCKDLGVDFIQGFFIENPTSNPKNIQNIYKQIKDLYKNDKRDSTVNQIEKSQITKIDSINIGSSLEELFIYLKNNPENHFVPIVDNLNQLCGAVYEKDIKKLSYSQYGMSLAKNTNMDLSLNRYIRNVVSAEITWSVDKILDIYSSTTFDKSGIFITKNNEYFGFVDLNALLELSYNRNIEIARDQNPLTKLPGNSQIERTIDDAFTLQNISHHIVYFDFNDFKPFNDYYGFRLGDRAILIFSDILKKYLKDENIFIGHIGGDDFFVHFKNMKYDEIYKKLIFIQDQFQLEASSLYNKKDRDAGYIKTKDRFGNIRKFKLLAVAIAIVEVNSKMTKQDFDTILHTIKKSAKKSDTPIGVSIC